MHILKEQGDVFVDALVSDHRAQLLFMSVFGRDTSIQQLMARLHLKATQGGVDQLSVAPSLSERASLQVMVGDPSRLDKVTGRMPRTGLLGNLVHAWIFDPAVLKPDAATMSGWLLRQPSPDGPVTDLDRQTQGTPRSEAAAETLAREADLVWRLVLDLAPVPLLDHWAYPVLAFLQSQGGLLRPLSVGTVSAVRVEIPSHFVDWVSDSVRCGALRAEPKAAPAGPMDHTSAPRRAA